MPRLSEEKRAVLESMTREALYEAAVGILQDEGLQGLTMERLAVSAGVAKGTVYNYFRDKREIVFFVAERTMEEMIREVQDLDVESGDPVGLLEESLDLLLHHMFEKRRTLSAMFRIITEDADMRVLACESRNRQPGHEIREKMVEIFRKGVSTGRFRPGDPALMDSVLHATLHGIIHEFIIHANDETDPEAAIAAVKDLILHGFCPEEKEKP
jgi:AcrR family transcriptional regulator